MDIRTEHGHQGRIHSRCIVIAQTMDSLYKQLVEYCCSSLSSSLVNYTTHIPHQISTLKFTCSAVIGHWSSGCYNSGQSEIDKRSVTSFYRGKHQVQSMSQEASLIQDLCSLNSNYHYLPYHLPTTSIPITINTTINTTIYYEPYWLNQL